MLTHGTLPAALRSRGTLAALVLLCQLGPAFAGAFETHSLSVQREGARYIVDMSAHLDAPAEQVGAVLTDYEHYPQLDARILESRREDSEPANSTRACAAAWEQSCAGRCAAWKPCRKRRAA
ncbi:MAG: hypothetical protein HC872_03275 [Gammaproteobacteria bacterium]|nr:hypothetical protein [Gammaproteobacteria bacterium]